MIEGKKAKKKMAAAGAVVVTPLTSSFKFPASCFKQSINQQINK